MRGSALGRGGADEVLRLENVSRSFTGVAAVEAVDLSLRRGEILTLLGPSGCGKTTTLRMASGLERCTSGRILYRGSPVDAPRERLFVPPERRDIGMVFQSYAVWPHMTVFENVAFPLKARRHPKSEIQTRVGAALAMMELAGFAQRLGGQLSGGQQQRVAIARGLVFEPDVLLLDEPFSNLDAQLRQQMRDDIRRLQRRLGISVLFVTHDQSEALALSDRVAVMRAGRIEQIGAPDEIYAAPATAFVRDFLGQWIKLRGSVVGKTEAGTLVRLALGAEVISAGEAGHEPGTPVTVAVRPELVGFHEPEQAGVPNELHGVVEALLFLGHSLEACIRFPSGETALAQLPRTGRWTEGQPIQLTLPPEATTLWPETSAP